VAYELSVTLTDEEYAELAAEAARSGKPVEELVHDILAQDVQRASPLSTPSYRSPESTVLCRSIERIWFLLHQGQFHHGLTAIARACLSTGV